MSHLRLHQVHTCPRCKCRGVLRGATHRSNDLTILMTESSTLTLRNLSAVFHDNNGGLRALDGLSFDVQPREFVCVLGPSGSGKTTLLRIIAGLIRPTSGSLTFGHVWKQPRIGMVFQQANLMPWRTVMDNIKLPLEVNHVEEQTARRNAQEMIELVGLENKADRPIMGFSGGERQRLGIAQAQVNYPDLLILDEPAASLDPQGRRDVLEVMSRLRRYTTIFYCTHILDDAQRVSDQVAIVNQGELITQTSVRELLAGTGELIYSVTLKGDAQSAYSRVAQQPWISRIDSSQDGEQTIWQVSVTDDNTAKDQLMGLLVSNGLKISNFSRKEQNLEDVFINIIERSQK